MHGFANAKYLGAIRKMLFPHKLPKSNNQAPKKSTIIIISNHIEYLLKIITVIFLFQRTNYLGYFYDGLLKSYCFNFMGSDKSVVQRTQYFNYEILNKRPVE